MLALTFVMPSRSCSPSPAKRLTNAVILSPIPKSYFDPRPSWLESHFASFGVINKWTPIRKFRRIMVVYESLAAAELAKEKSDRMPIRGDHGEEIQLRVYRTDDPQPLVPWQKDPSYWIPSTSYLQPPKVEKNHFISPPGSPPKDWVQVREDPPNQQILAEDLAFTLKQLELQQTGVDQPLLRQLIDPRDGPGIGVFLDSTPVEVEDYSTKVVSEEDWVYGETAPARQKWQPLRTSMPPKRMTIF